MIRAFCVIYKRNVGYRQLSWCEDSVVSLCMAMAVCGNVMDVLLAEEFIRMVVLMWG